MRELGGQGGAEDLGELERDEDHQRTLYKTLSEKYVFLTRGK